MKHLIFRPISLVVTLLLLASPTAYAGPRIVNCDEGGSLEDAILSGQGSAKELEITLIGTCYESFTISRDRVVVTGDGNTMIYGQIRIVDAGPVELSYLTISGDGHGVDLLNGRVRLIRANLSGNEGFGVRARYGSVVTMRDTTVTGNEGDFGVYAENAVLQMFRTDVRENAGVGIGLQDNSRLRMNGGSVVDQLGGTGVTAVMGSAIRLEGTTISGNGDVGVYLAAGSVAQVDDSNVASNSSQGLEVVGNSTLNFAGGEVSGNGDNGILASSHAFVELTDTRVEYNLNNGVLANTDSGIVIRGPTYVQFNSGWDLVCEGEEASAEVWLEPPGTIDKVSCTGF